MICENASGRTGVTLLSGLQAPLEHYQPGERKDDPMKNAYSISSLAAQLGKVADQIQSLSMCVHEAENNAGSVAGILKDILLDEVEHVQIIALELTRLIIPEENADEEDASVFAEGELQSKKGEAEDPE